MITEAGKMLIWDIELFYKGEWRFHNQEVDYEKADDWADWIYLTLKVPSRVVLRGEGVVKVNP